MTISAVGTLKSGFVTTNLAVSPATIGNALVLAIAIYDGVSTVTSVTGGGCTWANISGPHVDTHTGLITTHYLYLGTVTAAGSSSITVAFTGGATSCDMDAQEFTNGHAATTWARDGTQEALVNHGTASTTITWPSLTPAGSSELYVGHAVTSGGSATTPMSGFTVQIDADGNPYIYGVISATTAPTCANSVSAQSWCDGALITAAIPSTVAYASESTNTASGTTSIVLNKPPSTASGDLLVAAVNGSSGATAFTAPSGWTTMIASWTDSNDSAGATFWKLAGGSEPASYTFSWTTASEMIGSVKRYTATDQTTPIRTSRIDHKGATGASFTSTAMSGVQATDLSVVTGQMGDDTGVTTFTVTMPGAPWTTIDNIIADRPKWQGASYATGSQSGVTMTSTSATAFWNISSYAIAPAATAPVVSPVLLRNRQAKAVPRAIRNRLIAGLPPGRGQMSPQPQHPWLVAYPRTRLLRAPPMRRTSARPGTANATASATALAAATSFPAPAAEADTMFTVTALSVTSALPAVAVGGGVSITPATLSVAFTDPGASPAGGAVASPSALAVATSLPAVTVSTGTTISPAALSVTTAFPATVHPVQAPALSVPVAFPAVTIGASIASPELETFSFGTFPQIPAGSAIASVTVVLNQWAAGAGMGAPSFELWDGTTAQIGVTATGTATTSPANIDTATFTGVSYAQLATLQVRVYVSASSSAHGSTLSVNWVSLVVAFTPAGNAAIFPAALPIPVTMGAPAVSGVSNALARLTPLAVGVSIPAGLAGVYAATVTPLLLAAGSVIGLPSIFAETDCAAPAARLAAAAVIPAALIVASSTGPDYAGAATVLSGGTGTWTTPAGATGSPDVSNATWTVP